VTATRKNQSFADTESPKIKKIQPQISFRKKKIKASYFLTITRVFQLILQMLDFMGLFKLMQLQRDYRWDLMR
jgi:hypothetical protein